jgi:phosphoribosylamine---glycine ligase
MDQHMSMDLNANTPPEKLTLLLLGSGGREHALAWKLRQSPIFGRIFCAPGNPGIAACADLRNTNIEDPEAVVALAREVDADLVVVGPEAPLSVGVADALRAAGIPTFGPSKAAARLEWDKAFSKEFMQRHGIPTAASRAFSAKDLSEAREYVRNHSLPVVLKASGLAAGKGVVIAATTAEAINALEDMLSGHAFGSAGETVVVEEFMQGEEASIFAITDGADYLLLDYLLLASSQDHKRVSDDDTGPNTGGMGAYAPAPIVTEQILDDVRRKVIEPTLRGMKQEGAPYIGCLFVGLMIHEGQLRVVEFNSRLGDPEAQVILPLLDGDFAAICLAAATGNLRSVGDVPSSGSAVCIVVASEGYPGSYRKGNEIIGIEIAERREGTVVFHAGTKMSGNRLVTNGGRVLGVTAVSQGNNLEETIRRAYEAVGDVSFEGGFYRNDIGRKGLRLVEG